MRDRENKNTKRGRLLNAGKKLFSEKGFRGTSVREIAQEADSNVSMISYYFGGKEQLYSSIVEEFAREIRSFFSEEDVVDMTPGEKVRHYTTRVMTMHSKNPQLARILRHEMNSPTPVLDRLQKDLFPVVFGFLQKAFQEGIQNGDFRSDLDPVVMSYSVASVVNFYYLQNELVRRINPGFEGLGSEIIDRALDIFFNGVRASELGR